MALELWGCSSGCQWIIWAVLVLAIWEAKLTEAGAGNAWGYRGDTGPDYWHLDYPHCGGLSQSPISINTNDVIIDSRRLVPFQYTGYDSVKNVNLTLANNGHTVQVDVIGGSISIRAGGLAGEYAAKQFHFHWGSEDKRGSEHDLNGEHFPMEMHIVHYDKKYDSLSNAMDKENGLAVLSFIFKVGRYNYYFEELIRHFGQIAHRDDVVNIRTFPLQSLLPSNLNEYFRYKGSLTTPPCYESVIWTLFNEKIEIAEEQLVAFRTKVFENNENSGEVNVDISDDYRPSQCLNRRRVYVSHGKLKMGYKSSSSHVVPCSAVSFISILTICLTTILNVESISWYL